MTTTIRSLLLIAVAAIGASLFTTPAQAAHDHRFDELDRLASRLESESRTLALELRRYRYADPNLRDAAREVNAIARDARHVHTTIHNGASLTHLHRDVAALQESVHHLEEHLAPHTHFADHLQRIDSLVHAMDDGIHDLEHRQTVRRPVSEYRGVPRSSGISFGNGGISIRFGR